VYWAFLVWLYAAPTARYLRQAAIPVGIDPWVYPVYAVLFGRSHEVHVAFDGEPAWRLFDGYSSTASIYGTVPGVAAGAGIHEPDHAACSMDYAGRRWRPAEDGLPRGLKVKAR
jgi:hypothetical protein